jgi:hypothetical protein
MNKRLFSLFCLLAILLAGCDILSPLPGVQPLVSLPPTKTPTPPGGITLPTATIAPNATGAGLTANLFWTNGAYVQGWYWLRDTEFKNSAQWVFSAIPSGSEDIILDLYVLATAKVDGGRGANATFYMDYGSPGIDPASGSVTGHMVVKVPNISTTDDPVGYTCRTAVFIPRSAIRSNTLWISVSRKDSSGILEPTTVHIAFNIDSIKVRK